MKIKNLIFLCFTLLVGCGVPHYVDFFRYHDDGTPKPKVVFLPICREPCDQEMADYLDEAIRWKTMDNGQLYLYSVEEINAARLNNVKDVRCFKPADFVVETELVQNALATYENPCNMPINSKHHCARLIQLRMRITDIRCEPPKVILYEVIEGNKLLTLSQAESRRAREVPEQLMEDAVAKIEDTINCAN